MPVAWPSWTRKHRDLLLAGILFLAFGAGWFYAFNVVAFTDPDAYDYAQMGREIRRGHGMSTLQLLPRHVPYLAEHGMLQNPHWPNLYRYPLPPLLNAAFQLMFADPTKAAVLQSGCWFLLSVPILFLLAARLTNELVAAACTIFYAGDHVILRTSYSGMTESLGTFCLLAILLLLFRAKPRGINWITAGLLCGLAYLARTQLLFLLPLTVIYAWLSVPKANRVKTTALILIPACLTVTPWLIRNQALTGNPTFSFSSTRGLVIGAVEEASDIDMDIHAPVAVDEIRTQYSQAIRKKFLQNLKSNGPSLSYWDDIFKMQWPFLLFFLIGLALPSTTKPREWAVFKSVTLVLLVLNLLMVSLTLSDRRFYTMFRPLIILIGVYTAINLVSEVSQKHGKSLAVATFVIFAGVGVYNVTTLLGLYRNVNDSLDHRRSYEMLTELSDPTAVFASDGSRHISFVSDRRAVRLPGDPKQLIELHDKFLKFDYVLLTPRVLRDRTSGLHRSRGFESFTAYRNFTKTREFRTRFDFVDKLPNGAVLFKKR